MLQSKGLLFHMLAAKLQNKVQSGDIPGQTFNTFYNNFLKV